MTQILSEALATSTSDAPPITRTETGAKLQNGVEVETCTDRHPGPECTTAADWLKKHPHAKHPQR